MVSTTHRRRAVVGVVAVLVIAVVAGAWWLLGNRGEPEPTAETATSEPDTAHSAADALTVLETDPESLLPASLDGAVDVAAALPAGTQVEPDPATWTESAVGGGVMQVKLTYPDGSSNLIAAVMAQEGGDWVVLQTLPWQEAK